MVGAGGMGTDGMDTEGMDTEGMGMQILERTLAGYATHANFWGVLVVGLGCEANQINAWLAHSSLREGETLRVFNIQDSGGTRKTVERGIALIDGTRGDIRRGVQPRSPERPLS